MNAEPFINRLLDDEGIRGDLDDAESTLLVDRLVRLIEYSAANGTDEDTVWEQVSQICKTGRSIARTVSTYRDRGAAEARKVAQTSGFAWPTMQPKTANDLLHYILDHLSIKPPVKL